MNDTKAYDVGIGQTILSVGKVQPGGHLFIGLRALEHGRPLGSSIQDEELEGPVETSIVFHNLQAVDALQSALNEVRRRIEGKSVVRWVYEVKEAP